MAYNQNDPNKKPPNYKGPSYTNNKENSVLKVTSPNNYNVKSPVNNNNIKTQIRTPGEVLSQAELDEKVLDDKENKSVLSARSLKTTTTFVTKNDGLVGAPSELGRSTHVGTIVDLKDHWVEKYAGPFELSKKTTIILYIVFSLITALGIIGVAVSIYLLTSSVISSSDYTYLYIGVAIGGLLLFIGLVLLLIFGCDHAHHGQCITGEIISSKITISPSWNGGRQASAVSFEDLESPASPVQAITQAPIQSTPYTPANPYYKKKEAPKVVIPKKDEGPPSDVSNDGSFTEDSVEDLKQFEDPDPYKHQFNNGDDNSSSVTTFAGKRKHHKRKRRSSLKTKSKEHLVKGYKSYKN